jgi:hypothetical protein
MNAIQTYLMSAAEATIRKASADIINEGEIDPVMVVASMQELITHLNSSESSLDSTVECDVSYVGILPGKRPARVGDSGVLPMFLKNPN